MPSTCPHPVKPAALRPGNTIALVSCSSAAASFFPHRQKRAADALRRLGFKVALDSSGDAHTRQGTHNFELRLGALHRAVADPSIHAIVCNIGGHSANELIE